MSLLLGGESLTIHLTFNGVPFTVQIGHPLLALLGQIKWDSFKTVSFINPLYIVNDESDGVAGQTADVTLVQEPSLVTKVKEGLKLYPAEMCEEGVNGTYFLRDKDGKIVAVFKPRDEEGMASPKKPNEEEIVNRGILDGEGAQREVAAYLLDRDHFSGVPNTMLCEIPNFHTAEKDMGTKTGSLQEFVHNDGASWDIGPGSFPVHEVHKIGVLDMRIFNNDRHGGNILLKQGSNGVCELVPIDHGLSLSPSLEHGCFEWLMWPRSKQPFDEETKSYIRDIDVEEDAQLLGILGIRAECVKTMKITTTFLKKAAAAGLTLYDIGSMASRTLLEEPSELEKMVDRASKQVPDTDDDGKFLGVLYSIMDDVIAARME